MHPPRPALVGAGYLHPLTVQAKMMRQELLQVKAHFERELGTPLLTCRALLAGGPLGGGPRRLAGHWAHSEAASQGEPAV